MLEKRFKNRIANPKVGENDLFLVAGLGLEPRTFGL